MTKLKKHMKEIDKKSSLILAVILEKVSYMTGVLFITVPFLILMYLNNNWNNLLNIHIFINVFLAIVLFFQAWHLYIDAKIFRLFVENDVTTKEIDVFLVGVFFRKWLKNRTMKYRIDASIRLIKRFFITLVLHVISFVFGLFYFLNNYGSVQIF